VIGPEACLRVRGRSGGVSADGQPCLVRKWRHRRRGRREGLWWCCCCVVVVDAVDEGIKRARSV